MSEKGKISGWYSWPVIILALFMFWPVGLFLMIRRFSLDKKATVSGGGKGFKGWGIGLVIFGAIGFIGCISDASEDATGGAITALFFIAGGIVLMIRSQKAKKEAEKIRTYLSIIVNGNERQIDVIASSVGKSYDDAKNDIQKIIDQGYLKTAYINEGTRTIVLPSSDVQAQNDFVVSDASPTNMTTKIVTCSCCGANNTIAGETGECEYCGSPLK